MLNHQKTLVILPGWGGNRENWNEFARIAENDYRVVVFNLPGFGDEPCPQTAWEVAEYAEFVKSKIAGLDLTGPAFLFGHSFGGQVAVYLASVEPGLFEKLVLSGPAVIRPTRSFKRIIFFGLAKLGRLVFDLPGLNQFAGLARKVLHRLAGSPDYAKTSGIKREIYQKIIRQDLSHLLPKIKIPTLVVWGDKDRYLPLRNGRQIVKLIPHAKLAVVKGGQHGLHFQQPENLFKIVKEFLD